MYILSAGLCDTCAVLIFTEGQISERERGRGERERLEGDEEEGEGKRNIINKIAIHSTHKIHVSLDTHSVRLHC